MRNAGAVIHTHSQHAVMVTLLYQKDFRITHQEMIKGIKVRFIDSITNDQYDTDRSSSIRLDRLERTCDMIKS